MIDDFLSSLMYAIPVAIVMLVAFMIMRAVYGKHVGLHGYSYADSIVNGNTAAAIRFVGIFFGSTLGFWGVLSPTGLGLINDLARIVQCLVLVITFMVVAGYINDKLILHKIDNLKAIFHEANLSVALVECGTFIATGLILAASQSGDSTFLSNVMWFLGGQILLAGATYLFAFLHGGLPGVDEMHESMNVDNRSYAFSLFGFTVSVGIVLNVLIKNVDKPVAAILSLLAWVVVTFLLQFIFNRLMVPGRNLVSMVGMKAATAPNTGAGLLQGSMFLASALVITVLN